MPNESSKFKIIFFFFIVFCSRDKRPSSIYNVIVFWYKKEKAIRWKNKKTCPIDKNKVLAQAAVKLNLN